jgi:hypothetical protein
MFEKLSSLLIATFSLPLSLFLFFFLKKNFFFKERKEKKKTKMENLDRDKRSIIHEQTSQLDFHSHGCQLLCFYEVRNNSIVIDLYGIQFCVNKWKDLHAFKAKISLKVALKKHFENVSFAKLKNKRDYYISIMRI